MLPQITALFPTKTNSMYDLFAGGCNVCANIDAANIYANDINNFVIDIYKTFQERTIEKLLCEIDEIIARWELSKTNEVGYLALRRHYNVTAIHKRPPLELYALVCHSFNYQFRFNSKLEFNNPFGRDRSSFNPVMRENLITFHKKIAKIKFESTNFSELNLDFLQKGDFLYADPPYRITTASYNDGKRGFEGWGLDSDLQLFGLLDSLDSKGVKFALSNVAEHKGRKNDELMR